MDKATAKFLTDMRTEMRAGFKEMRAAFKAVDERFQKVDERFREVDSHFAGIESTLDKVADDVAALRHGAVSVMEFLGTARALTADRLDRLEARMDKLEGKP